MKPFLDFFPILLFFGAYKLYDIYTATAVLMAATVLQTAYVYQTQKRLEIMQKVTLVLVLGFGALTLGLHDERFIKWKPTVLYGAMTLGLAYAFWVARKNVVRLLLGQPDGRFDVDHQVFVARARQALHQLLQLGALQRNFTQPGLKHRNAGGRLAR